MERAAPLYPLTPGVLYIVLCGKVEKPFPTFLVSEAHTSQPSLRNLPCLSQNGVTHFGPAYVLIIIRRSVEYYTGHSRSFLLSQLLLKDVELLPLSRSFYVSVYLFIGLFFGRVASNLGACQICEPLQVERGICPRAL